MVIMTMQYCLFQDNTSAVIDIANTDDLQSEPGNGERLIVLFKIITVVFNEDC